MYCFDDEFESLLYGLYCDNQHCQCMDAGLSLINNAWIHSDIVCNVYHNTFIFNDNYTDYNIECNNSTMQCNDNSLINGLNAKSLTIKCNKYKDCNSLKIYCPNNGECNIFCMDKTTNYNKYIMCNIILI